MVVMFYKFLQVVPKLELLFLLKLIAISKIIVNFITNFNITIITVSLFSYEIWAEYANFIKLGNPSFSRKFQYSSSLLKRFVNKKRVANQSFGKFHKKFQFLFFIAVILFVKKFQFDAHSNL